MIIDNVEKLKHSCMQNGIQCKSLIGFHTEEEWKQWHPNEPYYFPTGVWCRHNWECGRGSCALYEPVVFIRLNENIEENTGFNKENYVFSKDKVYQVSEDNQHWYIISDNGWTKKIYDKWDDYWLDDRFEITEGHTIKYQKGM